MTESKRAYESSRMEERKEANRRYWKTPKGKVMMTFNNMSRRVRGYVKPHLYKGLDIMPREEFYSWSLGNIDFDRLFVAWEASGHERKLSPSVDRVDNSKGYTIGNIRWITHSENSRLGAVSRFSR